jgi:hypothetical protein
MKRLSLYFFVLLVVISCGGTDVVESTTTTTIPKEDDPLRIDLNSENLGEKIKGLFTNIEGKIEDADFEGWWGALSANYKSYLNNPSNLQKISQESDYLLNRNIMLTTPKDYFMHVVIRAREGKKLAYSDYELIDKGHIKVISLLDGTFKFFYNFILENGQWKLDR